MLTGKENIIKSNARSLSNGRLFFQHRLTINQPNDIYEQQADAMADKVMRMPANENTQQPFFKPAITPIQRKCAHCEEEEKLQRKESNTEVAAPSSTESYLNSLTGGSPLNENERSFFEPRMGYDFGDVKIHRDAGAAKSAQAINALAYTSGNDIVFNEGQYAPDTESGKKLLGHELTHVVQQNTGSSPSVQRAVFVCDEYRTVSPTTYNPGPGISLSLNGHAITIRANIEIYGGSASAAVAGQIKSTIERFWNKSFDDGYSVSTTANVTVQGAAADTSKTRIDIRNEVGVSNVAPTYWVIGANYMQYYLQSSDINWTPAHEFGHLLGLPDHYSEGIISMIGGIIDPSYRTTPADPGWEGNLMAATGGILEKKNLQELITVGFRARTECVRGHSESPL